VFGSLNIDLVQRVERLPVAGETIAGEQLQIFSGGKGANQACAAARLGGSVCMAGSVGDDSFGTRLKEELAESGVDVTRVTTSQSETGAAIILVLPSGENVIVISPGANGTVTPERASEALAEGKPGDILLCQLEIPTTATLHALRIAREREMIGILDPAPAKHIPKEALSFVTILIPNQTEAAIMLGRSGRDTELAQDARQLASDLLACGPEVVILKLGQHGCLVAQGGAVTAVPGYRVHALDTTAAGDTFSGGLAAELSRGEDLRTAVRFANAAAALCVTKPGAMNSIPKRDAVLEFLNTQ
jgi:ribokinase